MAHFVNYSVVPAAQVAAAETPEQREAARAAWEEAGRPELTALGRRLTGLAQWDVG